MQEAADDGNAPRNNVAQQIFLKKRERSYKGKGKMPKERSVKLLFYTLESSQLLNILNSVFYYYNNKKSV